MKYLGYTDDMMLPFRFISEGCSAPALVQNGGGKFHFQSGSIVDPHHVCFCRTSNLHPDATERRMGKEESRRLGLEVNNLYDNSLQRRLFQL